MTPGGETQAERDERLGRLARHWFAEIRAEEAAAQAAERRARPDRRDRAGDGDGPWDWLFGGDGDADGDGGD